MELETPLTVQLGEKPGDRADEQLCTPSYKVHGEGRVVAFGEGDRCIEASVRIVQRAITPPHLAGSPFLTEVVHAAAR